MNSLRIISAALLVFYAGCSSLPTRSDADLRARRYYDIADSLEGANSLREATEGFTLVAERYGESQSFQAAAYRAALLYCNPLNPLANDSSALHWLTQCSGMPLPEYQIRTVRVALSLVERIRALREQVARLSASGDGLQSQTKRQSGTIGSQAKRIQDLEEELRRTSQELKRLKEVDLKMSRSRQKK
jgi:hypothetical protein